MKASLLLLLLSLLSFSLGAQFTPYQTSPLRRYTFDLDVVVRTNRTNYEWNRGVFPNLGVAEFNGLNQAIDLYEIPDDSGLFFPRALPTVFSLEFWASWNYIQASALFSCRPVTATGNLISLFTSGPRAGGPLLQSQVQVGTVSQPITLENRVYLNEFQHIVLTVERTSATTPTSAHISFYVDSVKVGELSNARLPNVVDRQDCFLGKMSAVTTEYFSGAIDDFFLYNYALSGEDVSSHYVVPRPPIYELSFASDPRLILNLPNYTYSWQATIPSDNSDVARFHQGHLDLTGENFVDLYANRRYGVESWVGTEQVPTFGGYQQSGAGGTLPRGWSIEVSFRSKLYETGTKVFDLSDGQGVDNVQLGYPLGDPRFCVIVWSTFFNNHSVVPITTNALRNDQWYHMVLVFEPFGTSDYAGMVRVYVDGFSTVYAPSNMPAPVERTYSYIGKSAFGGDEVFDMYLDAFRIFDYALSSGEANSMARLTREPLPEDTVPVGWSYTAHPITSFTFNQPLNNNNNRNNVYARHGGTNYTWSAGSFPRVGVASFYPSSNNYVNLGAQFPDDGAFSPTVGGSMTIEVWARWRSFRWWSRIVDLSSRVASASDNILIANYRNTNELHFEVYGGGYQTVIPVPDAIRLNRWHHIVASVEQIDRLDTTSPTSARYRLFVDGQLKAEQIGTLPRTVTRPNSWLGRSNFEQDGDELFDGDIDQYLLYDQALTYEQVAAHYLLPKVPVFELAFQYDPRPWLNYALRTQFTYGWEPFDPSDQQSDNTQFHDGHLVLDGDQYVNLTQISGLASIGTTVPQLFGQSAYNAGVNGAYTGWTIELMVKIINQDRGAKLFSFSNGPANDEFSVGFDANLRRLSWVSYNPAYPQGAGFVIIEGFEINVWYHIVINVRNSGGNRGVFTSFVNGVETNTANNIPYPRNIARTQCYLGKSPYAEGYADMRLDFFKVYDFAVLAPEVEQLYQATLSSLAGIVRPLYTSGPLLEYTFDTEPLPSNLMGSAFTWQPGTNLNHRGLAHFNGQNEYINLLLFPDDSNTPFPHIFGNTSFSMEFWVQWDIFAYYSRLVDIGRAQAEDNIIVYNDQSTAAMRFSVYSGDQRSLVDTISPAINNSQWHFVVVTCEDRTILDGISPASPSSAHLTLYVDSRLRAEGPGYLPRSVERPFAYFGRSHWALTDSLFQGTLDSLYVYDYALSGEQVNAHQFVPRPAVFDASFGTDIRILLSRSQGLPINYFQYSWQEFDPTDSYSPSARFHTGHILLAPGSGHFLNFSAAAGPNSVGLVLPLIGGRTLGLSNTPIGWSFELIVKVDTVAQWAKLIDWGQGEYSNNICVGFEDQSDRMIFQVFNTFRAPNDQDHRMTLIDNVQLNRWYHIVITLSNPNFVTFSARWDAYVDGVFVRSDPNGWLPLGVTRTQGLVGKSSWRSDGAFAAKIDAIRVYDYPLTLNQSLALYRVAHGVPIAGSSTGVARSSSSSSGVSRSSSSLSSSVRSSSSSVRSSSSSSSRNLRVCTYPFELDYPTNTCFCPLGPFETCEEVMMCGDGGCSSTASGSSSDSSSWLNGTTIGIVVVSVVIVAGLFYCWKQRQANSLKKTDQQASLLMFDSTGSQNDGVNTNDYAIHSEPTHTTAPASHTSDISQPAMQPVPPAGSNWFVQSNGSAL